MRFRVMAGRLGGLLALLAVTVSVGCQGPSVRPEVPGSSAPPDLDQSAPQEVPLTADEQVLLEGLQRHSERMLSLGERNEEHIWALAEAADYLALELEGMGFPVVRQGYETERVAAQNLTVAFPGGQRGDQVLVVATHYDSAPGSAGRGSARATAALLELARMMRGAQLHRSLRLTFLSMGEAPHGRGEGCGARHYAQQLIAEGQRLPRPGLPPAVARAGIIQPIGAIVLGDLSGLRPGPSRAGIGDAGRATLLSSVALPIASNPSAFRLEQLLSEGFDGEAVEFERRRFAPSDCDAHAFDAAGLSVVALGAVATSPGDSSGPPDIRERDRAGALDPQRQLRATAQIVMRIRAGLGRVLGEQPTNDGMVTLGIPKDE